MECLVHWLLIAAVGVVWGGGECEGVMMSQVMVERGGRGEIGKLVLSYCSSHTHTLSPLPPHCPNTHTHTHTLTPTEIKSVRMKKHRKKNRFVCVCVGGGGGEVGR